MLLERGKFKDGSTYYGNDVIGPSAADIKHFNSLRDKPRENLSANKDLGVEQNALTILSEYLAIVGGKLRGPEAALATVLVAAACSQTTTPTPSPSPTSGDIRGAVVSPSASPKESASASPKASPSASATITSAEASCPPGTVPSGKGCGQPGGPGAPELGCPPGSVNAEAPRLGALVGSAVRVPGNLLEIQTKLPNQAPQGEWINIIYDEFQANAAHEWRGIGPWYPVAFKNLDGLDTAELVSHGNVGEIIVRAKEGRTGRVAISFFQEMNHQKDGAFGHDASGNIVKNTAWNMQYTFKGMESGQDILIVDADNGRQILWPDGSPMVFKANSRGEASFELPPACGDVRVQFVFSISSVAGVQPPEVKIERGSNDRPNLTGENKLPNTLIKAPAVPETK